MRWEGEKEQHFLLEPPRRARRCCCNLTIVRKKPRPPLLFWGGPSGGADQKKKERAQGPLRMVSCSAAAGPLPNLAPKSGSVDPPHRMGCRQDGANSRLSSAFLHHHHHRPHPQRFRLHAKPSLRPCIHAEPWRSTLCTFALPAPPPNLTPATLRQRPSTTTMKQLGVICAPGPCSARLLDSSRPLS